MKAIFDNGRVYVYGKIVLYYKHDYFGGSDFGKMDIIDMYLEYHADGIGYSEGKRILRVQDKFMFIYKDRKIKLLKEKLRKKMKALVPTSIAYVSDNE